MSRSRSPAPGQALVKVMPTTLCATDVEIFAGQFPGTRVPHAPGHEAAGWGSGKWCPRPLPAGDVASTSGAEDAEGYHREALAPTDELAMRPLVARCHLGLGILYRKTGRPDDARPELSRAVEMLRAMEMTFWLPEAEAELAGITT